jgi:molecular chaperone DnaK
VTFEIDVNGILKVSAQDRGTGREQTISISNTGGLTPLDIDRMKREAESNAQDDWRRLQMVELNNQAQSMIYSYESTLRDNGHLIAPNLQTSVDEAVSELQMAMLEPSANIDNIQGMIDRLQQKILQLGSAVYQKADGQSFSEPNEIKTNPNFRRNSPPPPPPAPSPPAGVGHRKVASTLTMDFDDDETAATDYEVVE